MRRIFLTAVLFLSACATAPQPVTQPPPSPMTPVPHIRSDLIGMTASELVQRFGTPALTVREGAGLKLQFRARACVLDAYLYPAGNAPERVSHVDARLPSGAAADQLDCIAALGAP